MCLIKEFNFWSRDLLRGRKKKKFIQLVSLIKTEFPVDSFSWHNIFQSRHIPNWYSTSLTVYNNNETKIKSLKFKESIDRIPLLLCYLINISVEARAIVSEGSQPITWRLLETVSILFQTTLKPQVTQRQGLLADAQYVRASFQQNSR